MMIGFEGPELTPEVIDMVSNYKIGSIILFTRNIEASEQTIRLTKELQTLAHKSGHQYPLIIATDQENGIVRRLHHSIVDFPGNMALGAINDKETTYAISHATANAMKFLGINMNLAPVLDVNSNPKNPVIGVRSFGEDVQMVSNHSIEFIKGHQDVGVLTSGKHFPGHGNTYNDSHLSVPVVTDTYERLKEIELVPFKKAIEQNIDSVLVSHVHYSAIDQGNQIPASLSKNIVTKLLREEMAFDGLVLTDCLEMYAISHSVGIAEGALRALIAGVDILIVSHTYQEQMKVIDYLEQAVEKGELKITRIDEALARIQRTKEAHLQWINDETLNIGTLKSYQKLTKSTYTKAVTIVKNDNILPINYKSATHIHVVWKLSNPKTFAEDMSNDSLSLIEMLALSNKVKITETSCTTDMNHLANDADVILLFTDDTNSNEQDLKQVYAAFNPKKLVVIAIKSPYLLKDYLDASALIAIYEPSKSAIQACVEVLLGREKAGGSLPVTIEEKAL